MQRKELMTDKTELPSRYWEPQPDDDDLMQMMVENKKQCDNSDPLPFE